MFLKVKLHNSPYPKEIVLNTDQIAYYYGHSETTTNVIFSGQRGFEVEKPESWFNDILVYKICDPTPVKEIDDHIDIDDNPLGFSTESKTDDRLATSKQIDYVRSIARKKGLDLTLPKTITFKFAKQFLDKYAPKKKKQTSEFDWEQLDEDADGEFPGYRD